MRLDTLTLAERSERMSRVRSATNKSTELRLIALLRTTGIKGWRRGVAMPGKPDFVFRAAKLAVFVDGCFWHRCPRHGRIPKTRVEFWTAKLARNRNRDQEVGKMLRKNGWRVLRIWEHELTRKYETRLAARIQRTISNCS